MRPWRSPHQFARVAPKGTIVGLDVAAPTLAMARTEVTTAQNAARVSFRQGDVNALPFSEGSFDVAWVSHVLHFQPDPVGAVRELRRVVARDGRVIVRENFSLRVILPRHTGVGKPGLEARLNAAFDDWFNQDRVSRGRMSMGWRGVLAKAGLNRQRVKSFLHEVSAPFSEDARRYLHVVLASRDDERLAADDRDALRRLLDADGPNYFLNRLDVHFISVSTIYEGRG